MRKHTHTRRHTQRKTHVYTDMIVHTDTDAHARTQFMCTDIHMHFHCSKHTPYQSSSLTEDSFEDLGNYTIYNRLP